MTDSVLDAIRTCFKEYGSKPTYHIACSSGLDSVVLLRACYLVRQEFNIALNVLHFNHQLHAESSRFARFCKDLAISFGLSYDEGVMASSHLHQELGVEGAARHHRYAFFASKMQPGDILFTAHHEDDQAETVLLQLLRGAGVLGLSAMSPFRTFADGKHARPFLELGRKALLCFAQDEKLNWLDDPTNTDENLSRNYLRQQVMPLLKQKWPSASTLLARSASHCQTAQAMLAEEATLRFEQCRGSRLQTLSIQKLLQLSDAHRALVLRHFIMTKRVYPPDQKCLKVIEGTILHAKCDTMPEVKIGDYVLRRYRDDLYCCSRASQLYVPRLVRGIHSLAGMDPADKPRDVESGGRVLECGEQEVVCSTPHGTLLAKPIPAGGHIPQNLATLNVRFLPCSATIRVINRRKHSLKKLFQEWGVPPWERWRTPLLFKDDELLGVPGYYWPLASTCVNSPSYEIVWDGSEE